MKSGIMKRLICTILVLMMVIGMLPAQVFAARGGGLSGKNGGKLSFTQVDGIKSDVMHPATKVEQEREEPAYDDADIVRVSIVLSKEATLEKFSTVGIATNNAAMVYRQGLKTEQETVIQRIEKDVLAGEKLDVVWNLTLAANIISANVTYGTLDEIAAMRGVKDVFIENQYEPSETKTSDNPMMSTASGMIGSPHVWSAGYTGAGTRIAVIDTGLDLNHQSFNNDAYLYALAQNAADKGMDYETYIESLNLLDVEEISAILKNLNVYPLIQYNSGTNRGAYFVSDKIPFAINYVDRDYDVTHDHDNKTDHGSHVAGIATANRYIPQNGEFVNALNTVRVQGVAPDAQVLVMKVFGKNGGAYDSDYMVAIEDAIMLGCDSINLSLGTDKGFTRNNTYQYILDSLADNDVILAVAAGNGYSWTEYATNGTGLLYAEDVDYSMVSTPSAIANTMSVASAENIGMTNYYIGVGDDMLFYTEAIFSTGEFLPTMTEIPGDKHYILIDGIGTAEEVAAVVAAEGGSIAPDTVLVCARGVINFGDKANNAIANGFAATIVYNNTDGLLIMNMDGYNYDNPVASVSLVDGMKLRNAATPVTDEAGNVLYYKGEMYISDDVTSTIVYDHYIMSDFSAWGVPSSLTMKPEITAPGGEIYSINGMDPSGTAYYNNSGTSMAAPQVAGMAALMMQYIKETGLDVKLGISARKLATSLLMSTAQPMKDGKNYYPILQQGAGLANVGAAVQSQSFIMMDPAASSGAADGKIKVELGDDPDRNGVYTFSFTLNNFGTQGQIYSLTGDFFTQDTVTIDGVNYTAKTTTALNMGVDFAVEGGYISASESYDCDFNGDGLTDAADAQIILNYAAELMTEIAAEADVNGDGVVNTYDAHLLLASIGTGYFMVEAGDSVTITVTMTMTEEAKAHLDKTFVNGAFVQGFVIVEPLVTEEGTVTPAHSIPVLGYYGNWSDPSMYDRLNYEDYVYAMENGTDMKLPYSGYTNYLTFFDEEDYEITYVGNPYLIEETFPYDKIAIRPEMEIGDMATSLIRNAGGFLFYVEDAEGNVVNAVAAPQLKAAYYYINAGYWNWVNSAGLSIWETPEQLGGFQEGDTFTIGFMAVPEYYVLGAGDEQQTLQEMLALKASGTIGAGAYYSHTFTVDATAPELLGVEKLEDGDLKINVQDNRHVAVVAVLTANGGTVLKKVGVDQDEIGAATELVIDMEDIRVNRSCLIMVGDYAGNETYYKVEDYNDGLKDFVGRMYGFTNTNSRSALNSWMEIDTDKLFYDGGDLDAEIEPTMGGTIDVAQTDFSVLAGEYVGGYIFMITDRNELRVAPQGEWDKSMLAATNPQYAKIRDMAYNTADGKLYALGLDNVIYTVDLYTGELVKQYQVSIVGPAGASPEGYTKKFTDEHKKLLALTIDDEGNFYAINNGDSTYQYVYLYSWSAEDVKDGAVTDLSPVNDSYEGYVGEYVYSDDMPASGATAVQSMAWDHDKDVMYWAAALGPVSGYNYLYVVDTDTGKSTIATQSPIPGVADFALGCMCVNISGLYIVPEKTVELDIASHASDLILNRNEITLLVGSKLKMQWDVLPWNLENKDVVLTTSDASVVTVDVNGNVIAVAPGKATITATTVAAPYMFATCEITVEKINDVSLNGMLYNADENIEWMSFNLLDAENWTSTFVENEMQFLAGGQHGDDIFVHDGVNMYGVNIDTFEVTDYGVIHETWQWSDGAPGPRTPAGYFDRMVGIISGGLSIGVMDVVTGMGYEVPHYSEFTTDKAALIAYVGPTTYHNGFELCYGHEYYILSENGNLYHDILYAFYDKDACEVFYDDKLTLVGETGLDLKGAANVRSDVKASMYYDLANDYLIVTAYTKGETASVYVFQPDACAPVEVGNFGEGFWPVVSLYAYDALTDVTVKVKPGQTECYVGETVQLNATVYMAEHDRTVTWTSSDETIATVNANGLVTALKAGTVTITATSKEANSAHQLVSASATITVKPLAEVDVMLHAYIQTEEGGKWVVIDGNNMDLYTLAASDAVYTGAGVIDGMIYATDETHYYMIDPAGNQYIVTQGDKFTDGDGADFMYMKDASGAPSRNVDLLDYGTNKTVNVNVAGYPVYLSGDQIDGSSYMIFLNDYATGDFLAAALDASRYTAGIAYERSEIISGMLVDFYYVLGYDGFLEHYSFIRALQDGELIPYDAGWEVDYVKTGLQFENGEDVSMVYVQTENFDGVIISHATAEGTELWCYDVVQRQLRKMGVLKGATDLVGLSLADGMDIEIPAEPDVPGTPEPVEAEYIYGYVKAANGYAWAKINTTDMTYEVLYNDTNNYAWPAAGAWNGKLYTVIGVTQYGNTTYTYQELDPANGYQIDANAKGDTAFANYTPTDFTGVPAVSVTIIDRTTGVAYNTQLGGYFLHASNGKYSSSKPMLFWVQRYTKTGAETEIYTSSSTFENMKLSAVLYVGSELSDDSKSYYDYFLILDQSGNLYQLQLTSYMENGTLKLNAGTSVTKVGKLDVAPTTGASFTRISQNRAYLGVNTADGAMLYSFNLTSYELKELGLIAGAMSITGLHTDAELTGIFEADEPTEPEQPEPECDHTNLGDWEHDENGHWKTCQCGEQFEQGEHEFVDGVCVCGYADPNYEAPCTHTNVGKWQHNTTTHWRTCRDCNEIVDRGEHQFVNGYCSTCSRPCDHSNVGEWNYYEGNHWQYCACGEMINYGPHEYHNGSCFCGAPCPHTSIGAWEYDENGHWKTCACGNTVNEGAHSFNNGKCACGYTDPNYVPENPGEPVDSSNWLHAYVKTADGYAWVTINSATGEYEVIAEGNANYTGGGYSGGKIYTTVNEYGQPTMYVVDPINGYTAVAGFMDDINFAKMMDAASGPAKTVTINGVEVQVGRPVYVGCDTTMPDYQYIGVIINPETRRDNKFASNEFYDGSIMRGIAFVSGEMAADGASYVETFVILFNNGKLYTCTVTYRGNTKADISVSLGDYVETGLDASKGASMTLVGENELCIALNTASGVALYSYDLAANTATKLADVNDFQSLVALSLMSDITGQPVATANMITSSLMSATARTASNEPAEGEDVVVTDGNVDFNLRVSGTNGKLFVIFDPAVLTYEGMTSASVLFAINDSEAANGKLIITYAAASDISVEDILGVLRFSCADAYFETVISVTTVERGEAADLSEKAEILVISAHTHTSVTLPGKDATCTEPGLTEGKKCSVCGEILVAQEEIPALKHTEETIPGKDATCTEPGLTEGKKCSVCGETLVAQEEIPALGHNFVDGECQNCGEGAQTPDTGDFSFVAVAAAMLSMMGVVALVVKKKRE